MTLDYFPVYQDSLSNNQVIEYELLMTSGLSAELLLLKSVDILFLSGSMVTNNCPVPFVVETICSKFIGKHTLSNDSGI